MTSVDDDDENGYFLRRRRRRPRPDPDRFPKVPSEAGIQLMSSGGFGANDYGHSLLRHKKKVARRIFDRELGINAGSKRTSQQLISQVSIPPSTLR
jgi:WD repeat-containing protein 23